MFRLFLLLLATVALTGCGAPVTTTTSLQPNNLASKTQLDSDGDGLTDEFELTVLKSDPHSVDTDRDGLADGEELTRKCSPTLIDTDADKLSDGDELNTYWTSPILRDTDGDGLSDGDEVLVRHTKPLSTDTDNDGINDGVDKCPLEPGVEMYRGCLTEN